MPVAADRAKIMEDIKAIKATVGKVVPYKRGKRAQGYEGGLTQLYGYVSENNVEAVTNVLEADANPDQGRLDAQQIKDKYGCTPLYHAAENGYDAIVELLLKAGAN